jgi:hypothetical protein
MIMWAHRKPSTVITAVILLIIAIAHLLRLFYHTNVMVSSTAIPVWISLPAVLITGGLAIWLWQDNRKE